MENKTPPWTERQRALLITLSFKVRFLSIDQIARTWWTPTLAGVSTTRRQMATLMASGDLIRRQVLAHPEIPLKAPVFEWEPGRPDPAFGALAYAIQTRWTETVQDTEVYMATPQSAHRLGGVAGEIRRVYQATHDLHMAAIYLQALAQGPARAIAWVYETRMGPPKFREKLPDAVLRDEAGTIRRIIEFGGTYDAHRIEKLHRYCVERRLPYELW